MRLIQSYQFVTGLMLIMLFTSFADARSFPDFTDLIEEKSPAVVKITKMFPKFSNIFLTLDKDQKENLVQQAQVF